MAHRSVSQAGQDLFALFSSGMKQSGFFVEFGAGDGVDISNTLMLERDFGWTGILAEPNPAFHDSIRRSRSARLETDCVWRASGASLEFIDVGYLSTLSGYQEADLHGPARRDAPTRRVATVSLQDLLRRHSAPRVIDYLSIDTEGSELEILSAFPFGAEHEIRSISCEHNHTRARDAVASLLIRNGYRRVAPAISGHDDWFVLDGSAQARAWLS